MMIACFQRVHAGQAGKGHLPAKHRQLTKKEQCCNCEIPTSASAGTRNPCALHSLFPVLSAEAH